MKNVVCFSALLALLLLGTVVQAQKQVFCMNCGTKLPANAKFCFSCGQKVDSSPSSKQDVKESDDRVGSDEEPKQSDTEKVESKSEPTGVIVAIEGITISPTKANGKHWDVQMLFAGGLARLSGTYLPKDTSLDNAARKRRPAPDAIMIFSFGKRNFKTKPYKDSFDPTFNARIPFREVSKAKLTLEFWDDDLGKNDFIGRITLTDTDLSIGDHNTGAFGQVLGLKYSVRPLPKMKPLYKNDKEHCFANQKTIAGAIEMFCLDNKVKIKQLNERTFNSLKRQGYLQVIPNDPGQGEGSWKNYYLTPDGDICCKQHGFVQ